MAFCFNFGENKPDYDEPDGKEPQGTSVPLKEVNEIIVEKLHIDMLRDENYEIMKLNGREIKLIPSKLVEDKLASQNSSLLKETVKAHSDLIPGVYEGGLKIWECSLDLTEYLIRKEINFKNLNVLEIGCGAGLPGIFAYLNGSDVVTFQDYNFEVLNYVTIPNVLLNTNVKDRQNVSSKCSFISGDWSNLTPVLLQKHPLKFDIILTSETIYSLDSQTKLLNLIKNVLKNSGIVYLAAKTFYFGVGGGTRDFEELVLRDGQLNSSVCHTIEEGVQREILQLKFK